MSPHLLYLPAPVLSKRLIPLSLCFRLEQHLLPWAYMIRPEEGFSLPGHEPAGGKTVFLITVALASSTLQSLQ